MSRFCTYARPNASKAFRLGSIPVTRALGWVVPSDRASPKVMVSQNTFSPGAARVTSITPWGCSGRRTMTVSV